MSQENVKVVKRLLAAYEQGGFEAVQAFIAPGFEMNLPATHPEGGRPFVRGEAARQMERFIEVFEDFEVDYEEVIDAGDRIVVVLRESGRMPGSPETVIDQRFAIVYELGPDHKITRMDWFMDRAEALEASGLQE